MPETQHLPVLLDETLELLGPKGGDVFIDATLGLGGHTEAILEKAGDIRVIGIDQDMEAIEFARKRLEKFGDRLSIVHSNFTEIKKVAGIESANGILADLGVSSLQFDSGERGFSFRFDAPLDMRMDADSDGPMAADLLADRSQDEIANFIYLYGEERASRKIARWIVEKRDAGEPVTTTRQLASLVERAVKKGKKDKIHPATRTFQALRIAVNCEIEILERFLIDSVDVLKNEGRLAVITFHSLEDRIVKQTFQKLSGKCFCPPRIPQCMCGALKRVEILTRKPVIPSEDEMNENPRSRSAKLRAIKKLN
ncbi:MAG: 16S rRNA (cytosine(1402)-N(4))-methyltransferase RsmH [Pyrinomonadaceae bacterium]